VSELLVLVRLLLNLLLSLLSGSLGCLEKRNEQNLQELAAVTVMPQLNKNINKAIIFKC
jgi:hypothetical protein